jgi:hypothetical protein
MTLKADYLRQQVCQRCHERVYITDRVVPLHRHPPAGELPAIPLDDRHLDAVLVARSEPALQRRCIARRQRECRLRK